MNQSGADVLREAVSRKGRQAPVRTAAPAFGQAMLKTGESGGPATLCAFWAPTVPMARIRTVKPLHRLRMLVIILTATWQLCHRIEDWLTPQPRRPPKESALLDEFEFLRSDWTV